MIICLQIFSNLQGRPTAQQLIQPTARSWPVWTDPHLHTLLYIDKTCTLSHCVYPFTFVTVLCCGFRFHSGKMCAPIPSGVIAEDTLQEEKNIVQIGFCCCSALSHLFHRSSMYIYWFFFTLCWNNILCIYYDVCQCVVYHSINILLFRSAGKLKCLLSSISHLAWSLGRFSSVCVCVCLSVWERRKIELAAWGKLAHSPQRDSNLHLWGARPSCIRLHHESRHASYQFE